MPANCILLVDDEPDIIQLLRVRLEALGCEIIFALNGKEALEKIRQKKPQLIISDILMPVMNGFEFYKALKKDPQTSEIPVLVLTSRKKMEETFQVYGVDDFLIKPVDSEKLVEKVNKYLDAVAGVASPGTSSDEVKSSSEPPQQAELAREQDSKTQQGGRQKRVLVSGDDDETVAKMTELLSKVECHVDCVTSASQLISKAVLFLPNVLLMDVIMDDIEAEEIIRMLRKMPQFEQIPIIVYSYYNLSDLGSEDVRQRALKVDTSEKLCLEAGATEYIGHFNERIFIEQLQKYFS